MKLDRFVDEREGGWTSLRSLLDAAGAKPERLGPARLRELGSLYRAAAADLAFARRAFPHEPVTRRLERLVIDARQIVYSDAGPRRSLRDFLSHGYWRRVRERPWAMATALLLCSGRCCSPRSGRSTTRRPRLAWCPPSSRAPPTRAAAGRDARAGDEAALSSQIFTNNIRVTFLAIAGGILGGLGTAAVTIFNGGFVGAIVGLTIENGKSEELLRLDGAARCPGAVLHRGGGVRGAADRVGARSPGDLTRGESLRREARPAMELVLGTMPWLVLAGLVEGFVTGDLGLTGAIVVGGGLGGDYWGLVIWRGSEARAGLGA